MSPAVRFIEMKTKLVIEALTAAGTFALAFAAIWGDVLRRPKLLLRLRTIDPYPVEVAQGMWMVFFHMVVINQRPLWAVHDCHVLLTGYSKKRQDGTFDVIDMPVPLQFKWAPAETAPRDRTIVRRAVLDLVSTQQGMPQVRPVLYDHVASFEGFITKGDVLRYQLEIEAPGLSPPKPTIVQVAWDGQFSHDVSQMRTHLRVREVKHLTRD
jgi:hypothetical protein